MIIIIILTANWRRLPTSTVHELPKTAGSSTALPSEATKSSTCKTGYQQHFTKRSVVNPPKRLKTSSLPSWVLLFSLLFPIAVPFFQFLANLFFPFSCTLKPVVSLGECSPNEAAYLNLLRCLNIVYGGEFRRDLGVT